MTSLLETSNSFLQEQKSSSELSYMMANQACGDRLAFAEPLKARPIGPVSANSVGYAFNMLTRIEINGFKLFDDFSLDLRPLTAVVDQNASDKSIPCHGSDCG